MIDENGQLILRRIRNRFDKQPTIHEVSEKQTLPSKTVPDQSLSIKELVERYIRGENVKVFNGTYAEEGEELFDTTGMTEMDMLDLARETAEYIKEAQTPSKKKLAAPTQQAPESASQSTSEGTPQ